MRKVYVSLRQSEVDALIRLAREERRRPQDQAALIIAAHLRDVEQTVRLTESAEIAAPA